MATAADAPLVVSDATHGAGARAGQASTATLFAGVSFFLVQRLPARSQLMRDIESNGGRVVKLEKQADFVIADHARTDAPTGSYSWKLITTAIRDGAMPSNPSDFPAGPRPGTVRDVGSGMPAKGTRTAFTLEEDRELWQWVEHEKARGAMIKGNEIYKRLEQVNPRHTFQAWRDRYIKKLMHNPPAGAEPAVSANSPPTPALVEDTPHVSEDFPTPPAKRRKVAIAGDKQDHVGAGNEEGLADNNNGAELDRHEVDETQREHNRELEAEEDCQADEEGDFDLDEADFDRLLEQAPEIENIDKDRREEAWEAWSQAYPHRNPDQWAAFWLEKVQPFYKSQSETQQASEQSIEEIPADGNTIRKRKRYFETEPTGGAGGGDGSREPEEPPRSASVITPGRVDVTTDMVNSDQLASESGTVGYGNPRSPQQRIAVVELPTSDANQAADLQIKDEVLDVYDVSAKQGSTEPGHKVYGPQNEDEDSPRSQHSRPARISGETTEVRSRDDFVWDEDESQGAPPMRSMTSEDNSDPYHSAALTEANLAHQQAQSREPLRRAEDLPEDDPAKDQSDFVRFLQDASNEREHVGNSAMNKHSHLQDAQESAPADDYSSGDVVDRVLRTNLKWPSSPQQPLKTTPNVTVASGRAAKGRQQKPSEEEAEPIERHNDKTGGSLADLVHHAAHTEGRSDIESEHDVGLTVAFPDVGGSFDPSSEHFDSQLISDDSPESRKDAAINYQQEKHDYQTTPTAGEIIEISSATPPSSSMESPMSSDDPHYHGYTNSTRARRLLETQDIFSTETQGPDLAMPLPPDSDDVAEYEEENTAYEFEQPRRSSGHMSATALPNTEMPAETMESESEAIILDSWISTMEVRGYEEHFIIQALKCTSMRLDLAELVLVHIKAGKGIPDDVPGVWHEEEDGQLEGGNAKAIRLLEAKHGWDACKARLEYLEEYRDCE